MKIVMFRIIVIQIIMIGIIMVSAIIREDSRSWAHSPIVATPGKFMMFQIVQMITDDQEDKNYQERSSCVRCPDLWRSQSSVPEEQQYHTWLAMIRNNDVAEKTVCFILPFTKQHHTIPVTRVSMVGR